MIEKWRELPRVARYPVKAVVGLLVLAVICYVGMLLPAMSVALSIVSCVLMVLAGVGLVCLGVVLLRQISLRKAELARTHLDSVAFAYVAMGLGLIMLVVAMVLCL